MNTILLQAGMEGGSGWSSIIMMLLIFVIFYMFMVRPQRQKEKEINKFRDSLMVGDQVMTSGGLLGKVKEIKDTYILVEIANNVNVKVNKGSIFPDSNSITPKN